MTRAQDAQGVPSAAVAVRGLHFRDAASYTRLNRLKGASDVAGKVVSDVATDSVAARGADGQHPALMVYDHLPDGFLAFMLPDHSCDPLVRHGEIAIVDVHDRTPEAGAIYLRRIVSSDGRARVFLHEIAIIARRPGPDGEDRDRWALVAHNRPRSADDWSAWSAQFGPVPLADGLYDPYGDPRAYPWDSLVGRVVGILTSQEHGL